MGILVHEDYSEHLNFNKNVDKFNVLVNGETYTVFVKEYDNSCNKFEVYPSGLKAQFVIKPDLTDERLVWVKLHGLVTDEVLSKVSEAIEQHYL